MKSHFHIEGLPPYDGDHELDPSYFTNRELHTIKRISGVRPGEMEDAFANVDNDLNVAFCVIALERAGLQVGKQGEDLIWDAKVGQVVMVIDQDEVAEDEAGPPEPPKTEPAPGETPPASNGSSTNGSPSAGDSPQVSDPSPTGAPHSGIGAV